MVLKKTKQKKMLGVICYYLISVEGYCVTCMLLFSLTLQTQKTYQESMSE